MKEILLSAPLRSVFVSKDKITNSKKKNTEINEKTQFYTKFWNLVKFKKENDEIFSFKYFCHDNIN